MGLTLLVLLATLLAVPGETLGQDETFVGPPIPDAVRKKLAERAASREALASARLKDLPADDRVAPLKAPLLDRSHVESVFRSAESWVKAGRVDVASAPHVPVSGVLAVRVTLRWLGKTMGAGESYPISERPEQVSDLTMLTGSAIRQALESTRKMLIERHKRAKEQGLRVTEKPLGLDRVGPLMLVDIQVAHGVEAVRVTENKDDLAVMDHFAPGYHGLRLSHLNNRQGKPAWMWPATAIASNIKPHSQLIRLLAEIGEDHEAIKAIGRAGGPKFERFEVIHMVRPSRDLPRTVLTRGHELIPPQPFNGTDIAGMSNSLAKHVIRRFREDGSMAGTYLPTADRFEPENAEMADVAMAVYALARYSKAFASADASGPNASAMFKAQQTVRRGVRFIISHLRDPNARPNAAAASLLLMAIVESPELVDQKADRDWLINELLSRQAQNGAFLGGRGAQSPPLNNRTQALVLAALATAYGPTADARIARAFDGGSKWLWAQVDPLVLIEATPWLSIAELRMRKHAAPDGDAAANEQWEAKVKGFRSLLGAMRSRQVRATPSVGPGDVIGGFDLTSRTVDTPPRPDWRTSESLILLSQSLRESALKDDKQQVSRLLQCGLAARFLAQLMMEPSACYYVRSVTDAQGGIREMLWRNELHIEPSAMGLIALSELHETLGGLERP